MGFVVLFVLRDLGSKAVGKVKSLVSGEDWNHRVYSGSGMLRSDFTVRRVVTQFEMKYNRI